MPRDIDREIKALERAGTTDTTREGRIDCATYDERIIGVVLQIMQGSEPGSVTIQSQGPQHETPGENWDYEAFLTLVGMYYDLDSDGVAEVLKRIRESILEQASADD